jgi:hypothetical protein
LRLNFIRKILLTGATWNLTLGPIGIAMIILGQIIFVPIKIHPLGLWRVISHEPALGAHVIFHRRIIQITIPRPPVSIIHYPTTKFNGGPLLLIEFLLVQYPSAIADRTGVSIPIIIACSHLRPTFTLVQIIFDLFLGSLILHSPIFVSPKEIYLVLLGDRRIDFSIFMVTCLPNTTGALLPTTMVSNVI